MKIALIRVMFVLYLYALIQVILFKFHAADMSYLLQQLKQGWNDPERILRRLHQGNLIPFEEISRAFHAGSSHGFINLFGNIALFIPYGMFQEPMGRKMISCMVAIMRSFGVSLGLESAQTIFFLGSFDVDDLILNTCGGLIGFLAFRLYTKSLTAAPNRIQTGGSHI